MGTIIAERKVIPLFLHLNKRYHEGGDLQLKKAEKTVFKLDGKRVPSVSTILGVIAKPALYRWNNQMGLAGVDTSIYVDELARVGTLIHEMIQEYLGGNKWDRDAFSEEEIEQAENPFISFVEWAEKGNYNLSTKAIELSLVSEIGYGGKIDWYGTINEQNYLVDIKTSKAIYPEHLVQLAAYNNLMRGNSLDLDASMIIRIGRKEEEGFEVKVVS